MKDYENKLLKAKDKYSNGECESKTTTKLDYWLDLFKSVGFEFTIIEGKNQACLTSRKCKDYNVPLPKMIRKLREKIRHENNKENKENMEHMDHKRPTSIQSCDKSFTNKTTLSSTTSTTISRVTSNNDDKTQYAMKEVTIASHMIPLKLQKEIDILKMCQRQEHQKHIIQLIDSMERLLCCWNLVALTFKKWYDHIQSSIFMSLI